MHMKNLTGLYSILTLSALCLVVLGCAQKQDEPETAAIPYPLDICIVTGEKLDTDPGMVSYTFVHEGQEFKLCCKGCLKDFNKEPEKYLAKLTQPAVPAPTE